MKKGTNQNEDLNGVITYQSPTIEVIDIEIEQNTMAGSPIDDFGDGGNPPFGER